MLSKWTEPKQKSIAIVLQLTWEAITVILALVRARVNYSLFVRGLNDRLSLAN